MMSRRFIFGSLLLLQTAFSLLGNAGLHSALGCHHDHGATASCTAPQPATTHQHCRCKHTHDQTTPADHEHQHSPPPLSDDDCAICQFFTRPAETTVVFQWMPWIIVVSEISFEIAEQPGVLIESVYEVRGPPLFA